LFRLRDDYASRALTVAQCSPTSVVCHCQLLEGFEMWQQAFRLTHAGDLDAAFDQALEASRLLRAVGRGESGVATGLRGNLRKRRR